MNLPNLLLAITALVGLASGPSSLESAALSQPPIELGSVAFAFAGALVALPIVLGFQAAFGNNKALRWGWSFFLFVAVYITTTGISALATAMLGTGIAPYSFLFLAIGIALLAGLAVAKLLFASSLANG